MLDFARVVDIERLVEVVVWEMFPRAYMEGKPPIQAREGPWLAGAHTETFARLVRSRDVWVEESQEYEV